MDSVGTVKDNPIKFDIKAAESEFYRFIDRLKAVPSFTQTSYTPSDEKNHFVIYKFSTDGDKCAIVYDTKASKISLTAKSDVLERFKAIFFEADADKSREENEVKNTSDLKREERLPLHIKQHSDRLPTHGEKKRNMPIEHKQPQKSVTVGNQQENRSLQPSRTQQNHLQKQPQVKPLKQQDSRKTQTAGEYGGIGNAVQQTQAVRQQQKAAAGALGETAETPEYKNGYAIKKYSRQRLSDALASVKSMKGVSYKTDSVANKGKPDEAEIYIVSGTGGQKVILRYMPKKEILQMQGKRSYLFSEVQVLILKGSDFREAVGSHIVAEKGSGVLSSAGGAQRRLKKILPNAFDFLSEQSKIDLTIGLIDINNNETRLSDYSSLLTPPYRGLEKFISDLQRAKGIEVKMIGQGYEKDDSGNYLLKSGYRKRINSVVYNEVMSALYTEYFARRNFYTHSDVTDGSFARIITDKQEVKKIFDNLIEVIDYNSKKLKEIGFTVR